MMLRIKWLPHFGTLLRNSGCESGLCTNFRFSSFSVSGFRLILIDLRTGLESGDAEPSGLAVILVTKMAPERLKLRKPLLFRAFSRFVNRSRLVHPAPQERRPTGTYKEFFIFAFAKPRG
jgi:hypothetical protein